MEPTDQTTPPFQPRGFNPRSGDAMFARVLERLDQQDRDAERRERESKEHLTRIETQVRVTNGRVTALENWKIAVNAKVALVASGISVFVAFCGWIINHWPAS